MSKPDGGLVMFSGVPLHECRQCGEQYVSGEWSEKIGHLLKRADPLSPEETLCVPVIAVRWEPTRRAFARISHFSLWDQTDQIDELVSRLSRASRSSPV